MTERDKTKPDVEITTNVDPEEFGIDVNVMSMEELLDEVDADSRRWFRTHVVDPESETGDDDGWLSGVLSSVTGSGETSRPASGPSPEPSNVPRGTFAFPNDEFFMQALEVAGKNGAHERVETVYVLMGPTYTDPSELFALDDPEYYTAATPRAVVSRGAKMATAIANRYPDGESPSLIARFHTHPGGSTTPSDQDRDSARAVKETFERAFGTDDFEFFHGIHAYIDHAGTTEQEDRRNPEASSNGVSWYGEQYRHEFALYGADFANPRKVVVRDDP